MDIVEGGAEAVGSGFFVQPVLPEVFSFYQPRGEKHESWLGESKLMLGFAQVINSGVWMRVVFRLVAWTRGFHLHSGDCCSYFKRRGKQR